MNLILFTKPLECYLPVISEYRRLVSNLKIVYPEYQPKTSDPQFKEFLEAVEEFSPDAIVSFFYSRYIPSKVFSLAKYALNYHPSLLPNYGGAHALNWQIVNGEEISGVTIHVLTKEIDGGDIALQKTFPIAIDDDINAVLEKAIQTSKDLTPKLIDLLETDSITFKPQCPCGNEFVCKPRTPEDGELSADMTDTEMYNMVRALAHPWPGAYYVTEEGKKYFKELTAAKDIRAAIA